MEGYFSDNINQLDWIEYGQVKHATKKNLISQLNSWESNAIKSYILGKKCETPLGSYMELFVNKYNRLFIAQEKNEPVATILTNPRNYLYNIQKLIDHRTYLKSQNPLEVKQVLSLENTEFVLNSSKYSKFTNICFLVVSPELSGKHIGRRCLTSLTQNAENFSDFNTQIITAGIAKMNEPSKKTFLASGFKPLHDDLDIISSPYTDYFFIQDNEKTL